MFVNRTKDHGTFCPLKCALILLAQMFFKLSKYLVSLCKRNGHQRNCIISPIVTLYFCPVKAENPLAISQSPISVPLSVPKLVTYMKGGKSCEQIPDVTL